MTRNAVRRRLIGGDRLCQRQSVLAARPCAGSRVCSRVQHVVVHFAASRDALCRQLRQCGLHAPQGFEDSAEAGRQKNNVRSSLAAAPRTFGSRLRRGGERHLESLWRRRGARPQRSLRAALSIFSRSESALRSRLRVGIRASSPRWSMNPRTPRTLQLSAWRR